MAALDVSKSSSEAAQEHSASSEKRFKTKAEMKVPHWLMAVCDVTECLICCFKAFPVVHGSPTAAVASAHSCEDEDEIYPLTKPSADSTSDAELDSDTFLKVYTLLL